MAAFKYVFKLDLTFSDYTGTLKVSRTALPTNDFFF